MRFSKSALGFLLATLTTSAFAGYGTPIAPVQPPQPDRPLAGGPAPAGVPAAVGTGTTNNVCCAPSRFTGWYAGPMLSARGTFFNYTDGLGHDMNTGAIYPSLGIFGGYGWDNKQSYLAAELYLTDQFGSSSVSSATLDSGGTILRLRSGYSVGASFLPGLFINERTVGFLRLGLVWTRMEAALSDPIPEQLTDHKTQTGLELGIGFQTTICCNFDVRGEFAQTYYRPFTTTINQYHVNPVSNRATVSFVYKFLC